MPRRRVTMLEAFQVSARQSVERAAAERRRAAESRRAQVSRDRLDASRASKGRSGGPKDASPATDTGAPGPTADDIRTRADSAGRVEGGPVGGGPVGGRPVGSMWASLAGEAEPPPAAGSSARSGSGDGQFGAGGGPGAPVDLGTLDPAPPPGAPAPPAASGPSAPAIDRTEAEPRGTASFAAPDLTADLPPGPRTTAEASAALEARLDRGAIADAIEAAAGEEFTVPMRARTFAALGALALVAVFALGYAVGSRVTDVAAPAETAERTASGPGEAARAGGGFALPAPPRAAPETAGVRADPAQRRSGTVSGSDRSRDARSSAASAPSYGGPPGAAAGGAGEAAADGLSPADRAFLDPANAFSILAIRYQPSAKNIELAWETHATLARAGLPVVSPVTREGDRMIYLFVGAAEAEAQLAGLLDRVKRFEIGPRGRRDFASAQLVALEPYR